MKKTIFSYLFLILIMASCEKSSTVNSDYLIVLNGYLYQDEHVDSIRLVKSLPFASEDTIYNTVDDAQVSILWNNQKYSLRNIGSGYYNYMGDDLLVREDDTYSIEIDYHGQIIASSTTVPHKTSIYPLTDNKILIDTVQTFGPPLFESSPENGLTISWNNTDKRYYFVVIESSDSTAGSIVMGNSNFPAFPGNGQFRAFRIRSEPFIGNTYTINTRMLTSYGKHVVKVYSVNQEYADLYENRVQDSRSLSEPVTNVKNGLGIFTAFSYTEVIFYAKNKYRD